MKKNTLKKFLLISACYFVTESAVAYTAKEEVHLPDNTLESASPEQMNGIIKKMMLVASDVLSVETKDYEQNEFTKIYEVAQYEENRGLIQQYWDSRKDKSSPLDETVNPLYWDKVKENYLKKSQEDKLKQKFKKDQKLEKDLSVKDDDDTAVFELDEGVEIMLKRKPEKNYRKSRLPSEISKKSYHRENEHLPVAVYEEEYKQLLVNSIIKQDINVMRAIIERLGTTEVRDTEGNTPLLYAVIAGNPTPIKILVGMGASVNARNKHGVSPLYIALKDRNLDLVKQLIKQGANINVTTENGKTLLMTAAENNDVRMVNMLLGMGVDINKKMDDGNTALHFAAMRNSSLVSDILVTKGAVYDSRNKSGYTPLMIAAAYGSTETVNLLINTGANLSTTDAMGQDAYLLARNNNHHNITTIIERERESFLNYQPEVQVSPIDETLSSAPIPLAKPSEEFAPVEVIDNAPIPMKEPIMEAPATNEDSTAPYEMPMPTFTQEELDQM